MKKFKIITCLVILIVALVIGILSPLPIKASAANGHLIWDEFDRVWRCVGSPLDCAGTAHPEA